VKEREDGIKVRDYIRQALGINYWFQVCPPDDVAVLLLSAGKLISPYR
jgi:hypothetical protein